MSTLEHRIIDVTTETVSRPPDDADLHMLRLALDLQVDAMLLTLGAAARAPEDERIPWRRWVVEDLDAARILAQTILSHHVDPPHTLGAGRLGCASPEALDDLIARYTSMDELLGTVLQRPYEGQAWRPTAHEARTRCRARLEELHRHRGLASVRLAAPKDIYLPGELLG